MVPLLGYGYIRFFNGFFRVGNGCYIVFALLVLGIQIGNICIVLVNLDFLEVPVKI